MTQNVDDSYYYSLAVQAGYLTYTAKEGTETHDRLYEVFIPNMEARHTWKTQILSNMGLRPYSDFIDIFENISDTEKFSSCKKGIATNKTQIRHKEMVK